MPFVGNADVAEAHMRYTWNGQIVENVLHFLKTGGFDATALSDLGTMLRTWHASNLRGTQSNGATNDDILTKSLGYESAPSYVTAGGNAGTLTSASQPNNVTAAIKLVSAFSSRSTRGRVFHVGLTQSQVTGSTLTSAAVSALQAAYAALIAAATSAGIEWGVYSRVYLGVPRDEGLFTPILSVSVDPTTDSQRRRLPGRGR